jgi:hypothetical protein
MTSRRHPWRTGTTSDPVGPKGCRLIATLARSCCCGTTKNLGRHCVHTSFDPSGQDDENGDCALWWLAGAQLRVNFEDEKKSGASLGQSPLPSPAFPCVLGDDGVLVPLAFSTFTRILVIQTQHTGRWERAKILVNLSRQIFPGRGFLAQPNHRDGAGRA